MLNQDSHKLVTWIFVHVILLDSGYFTTNIIAAPSPILRNGEIGLSGLLQSAQKTVTTIGDVISSAKGQVHHVINETISKRHGFGRSRQTLSSSSRQEFAPQISLSSSSSSSFGHSGGVNNYSGGNLGGGVVHGQTHHVVVERIVSRTGSNNRQPFNSSNLSQSQSQSTSWAQSSNGGSDHVQQLSSGDFGNSYNSNRSVLPEEEDDVPAHALEFSAKGGGNRGSSIVHSRRTISGGSKGHNSHLSNGFGAEFSGSGTTTIRQSSVSTKTVSHSRRTLPQAETTLFSVINQRNSSSSGTNNISTSNASGHLQPTTGGVSKQTFQGSEVVEDPVRKVNVTKLGSEQHNTSITQEESTNSSISDQTFEDDEDSDEVEVVANLNQALSWPSNSEKIMQVPVTPRTSSEDTPGTGSSGFGNENVPLIASQAHNETDLNLRTTIQETGNGNTAQEQQVSQSVARNNDNQSKSELRELSSGVHVPLNSSTSLPVPVKVFENDNDVEVDVEKNQQPVPPMSLVKSPPSVRPTSTTTMKPTTTSTTSRAPATSPVAEVVSTTEKIVIMQAPTTSTTTTTENSSKANFSYSQATVDVGTSSPSLIVLKTDVSSAATSDSDTTPVESTSPKSANCNFQNVTDDEDNSTEFVNSLHYSSAKCEREIGLLLEEIWFLHLLLVFTCFLCLLVLFVLPMLLCYMSTSLLKRRNKVFVSGEPVEAEINCVDVEKKDERSESSHPSAEKTFKDPVDHCSSKLITTSLQSRETSITATNHDDEKREQEKTLKSNILQSTQQICNESGKSTLWNIDKELLQKRSHQNVYIEYKTPRRPGPVPLANNTATTIVVTTKTDKKGMRQDHQNQESDIKVQDLNQIGKENYYETVEEKESCIIVPPSTPVDEKSTGKVLLNSSTSKSATIPGHQKDAKMNLDNFSSSPTPSSSSEVVLNHDPVKDVSKLKYEFLMGSSAENTDQSASANYNSFLNTYNRLEKRLEMERKRVRSGEGGASRLNASVMDSGLQYSNNRSNIISGSFLQHSSKSGSGSLFNEGSTLIVNKKEGWFKFENGFSSPSSVTKVQKIIQVDDDVY